MILWHLVAAVLAPGAPLTVAGDEPAGDGHTCDPAPPPARSRGPPHAHDPGRRTARLARTGTCPIHHDPVPSTHDPG